MNLLPEAHEEGIKLPLQSEGMGLCLSLSCKALTKPAKYAGRAAHLL